MRYRSEIDGLRAIAVGSVVLAHAGVSVFQGGFVGVDVFFVISGYLITSLMLADRDKGRFSLSGFYFRRARRILPALFVVFVASLPFAWWLMVPSQLVEFGRSLTAATLFLSNAHFWEKTGYFQTASELMPLLHTWSLAVEEQYYLLFPFVFLLVSRFCPKAFPYVLGVLVVMSLSLSEWGAQNLPEQNFFFTFSRFWEILLGALCACLPVLVSRPWHRWASLAGLGLIGAAIFGFTPMTPTPSLVTLLPTCGAALVLLFGARDGLAKRFLTLPAMIGLGAISYSVYLWHQPVFAFARLYHVTGVPPFVMAMLVLLVLVLSYLSWRFVEQPFRHGAAFTKRRVFTMSGAGIAAMAALGSWINTADLGQYRYSKEDLVLLNYDSYYRNLTKDTEDGQYFSNCVLESEKDTVDLSACLGIDAGIPVLWGDSHAQALASGVMRRGIKPSLGIGAGCPPVISDKLLSKKTCLAYNEQILTRLVQADVSPRIYMHANWVLYLEKKRQLFLSEQELVDAVFDTIERLRAGNPAVDIVLVGGVPQWGESLPVYIYRHGMRLDRSIRIDAPEKNKEIRQFNAALRKRAADRDVTYTDPFDVLCNSDGCMATIEKNGVYFPMAWDYGHMTAEGAAFLFSNLAMVR